MAGTALYGAMLVLGIVDVGRGGLSLFGTPTVRSLFPRAFSSRHGGFAVLGGLAIAWRKSSDAHKRLIILATICIADAGFSRWLAPHMEKYAGNGYWGNSLKLYLSDFLLVALLGAYDLFTRGRLYGAYVFGAVWGLGLEFIAIWLYVSPWWKPVATTLIGR